MELNFESNGIYKRMKFIPNGISRQIPLEKTLSNNGMLTSLLPYQLNSKAFAIQNGRINERIFSFPKQVYLSN